jgi:WD40 repeat protein/tRNA A-37 threonylcarbamoyl transferase component Bud32
MTEPPLNHPSDEVLRALSLGQLAETELAHVSAHLGDCLACCRRIDQLTTDDRLLARVQEGAASREKAAVSPAQRRSAVRALRRVKGGAWRAESGAVLPSTPHAPPSTVPTPRQVGDYDILAEVGRGGMGVVYKARHRGLHRLAALKMVLAGEFASPTQELRFRLEAELAARVQHPNIVQVYEIGSYEGRPFLALEWVEGGSLANRLDGKPWPPNEAAALIETLARAIDVAHIEGVIHRDLKPANILLVSGGVVSGECSGDTTHYLPLTTHQPKITDFGLAQPIEGGQTMTQSGFLVGTPGYMAPEQASGKRALVGPATDIYALGVVLFQLVTGQLPFQRDSTLELLRAVTSDEPPRPRRLQPRLPRDLEAITLHCLEKEPGRRYPSALALAEDLERFRAGKQVVARPVGAAARLARACRRRPLVATLLALLAISLFAGLAGVTWQWLEANDQRDLANTRARQADDEKKAALYQTYRACLAAASAALQNHDVADAARHLKLAPEALQGWEWRHLHSRLDDSSAVVPLPASGARSAGNFLIAAPDRLRIGVLTSAGLRITDLEGGEQRTVPIGPERGRYVYVAQTSRGLRVAAWVGNTNFEVLDDAGQVVCRVAPPENDLPAAVFFSPDGTRLCVHTDRGRRRIAVFDATSGKQTAICDGHGDAMWVFSFSPDSAWLASGSEDRTARVWNAATGELLATCRGHTSKVLGVAFSPDGSRLVTASSDGTVRQWDASTGQEVGPPYDRHSSEVLTARYSPDGQWIASAGTDRTVRVWRATDRQDVAILHGHTGAVRDVAFSTDGRRLASQSDDSDRAMGDSTVRVWEVDPRAALPVLRGHTNYVYPVAFSPDGRWLASGSWDSTVRLWDAATGEPCATLPHAIIAQERTMSLVWDLAFGPDGTWLVTQCPLDGRLRMWDVATARVRKEIRFREEIQRNAGNLNSLAISPDGTRVATSAQDPKSRKLSLNFYDIASGNLLFSTEGMALAYSPDGRWLAVLATDEKTVLLLDARTHETIARFRGHEDIVFKAAFSPDSRLLASCSRDRTVRLWQIDPLSPSGEGGEGKVREGRLLGRHTDEVFTVAFHPDGTRLATGGRDGAVWLWDVKRGEEVVRLPGHKSYVWSLAFSPDGATLASGSGDATVRLWDTAPLKARYDARRQAAALRPEAERLVEQLWREKNDPAEVVATLRAARVPSEALREEALRAVLRQVQPPKAAPGNPLDPP